jgi:hypothetical protein
MMWLVLSCLATMCFVTLFYLFAGNDGEVCTHDWEVRGAMQMYRVTPVYGIVLQAPSEGTPITEVLYRCRDCGDVKTETLDGHWTYEQLSDYDIDDDEDNTTEVENGIQSGADGDAVGGGDNPDGVAGNGNNC